MRPRQMLGRCPPSSVWRGLATRSTGKKPVRGGVGSFGGGGGDLKSPPPPLESLSPPQLCGRVVDTLIYGAAGLLTLQAAVLMRDPGRLLPSLPSRKDGGGNGKGALLDPERPPDPILNLVRETLIALDVPHEAVRAVLIPGTSAKSAGSINSSAGARVGLPLTTLECLGYDNIRRSPLPLDCGGWASPLGQELYATLSPTPEEVGWVVAHECAHLKHEDGLSRAGGMGGGLLAYHATTKLLWRRFGHTMSRLGGGGGLGATILRGVLVGMGPLFVCSSQILLARQQELNADFAASALSLAHAQAGISHLRRQVAYRTFRRDHMGDGNFNEAGDAKGHGWTHPATAVRIAAIEAQLAADAGGGEKEGVAKAAAGGAAAVAAGSLGGGGLEAVIRGMHSPSGDAGKT